MGGRGRGNKRVIRTTGRNHDSSAVLKALFSHTVFLGKWKNAMSAERQARIIELFTIPRDDPYDVYKPNSKMATQILAETPVKRPLNEDRIQLLHEIAANYDRGIQLDIIESYRPNSFVSNESWEQLMRLPTWLRFLILVRYDAIHRNFGHHTHHFLKMIANFIETLRTTSLRIVEGDGYLIDEDVTDNLEIFSAYFMEAKEVMPPLKDPPIPGIDKPRREIQNAEPVEDEEADLNDIVSARRALWRWMLPKTLEQDWAPTSIHRAATTLRRALLTLPTATELTLVEDDDKIKQKDVKSFGDDYDDYSQKGKDFQKPPSWEDIFLTYVNKETYKEEIAEEVDQELRRMPKGMTEAERFEEEKLILEVQRKEELAGRGKKKVTKSILGRLKDSEFFRRRREKKERKLALEGRQPWRKYSAIWHKNCPDQDPVKQATRLASHYSWDASFHSYIRKVVSTQWFKVLILAVIVLNAVMLGLETIEIFRENHTFRVISNIMDMFFLSVYLVEFLLKIYAQPVLYWSSGFNIFDFVILLSSLTTFILEILIRRGVFQGYGLVRSTLRLLVIFRALRILRGVSMSPQMQVLITALIETMRTHVLSVLILLFLLMYIAAILAYYLFGSRYPSLKNPWGQIGYGMLRLFSFVTMDGWTDTSEEFEKAGLPHEGHFFCLMCVLVGNFIISNIFIAVIIMQISEARDDFRTQERDEREDMIALKREIVFRRQKLDMRQLLAKQESSEKIHADTYYMGSQFLRLLRHDDLVEMNALQFSPLWLDAFYKSHKRSQHTANIVMNLHRQLADNLLEMWQLNSESRYRIAPIRRSRFNRYCKIKSKLTILREAFYRDQPEAKELLERGPLRIRFTEKKKEENPEPKGPLKKSTKKPKKKQA